MFNIAKEIGIEFPVNFTTKDAYLTLFYDKNPNDMNDRIKVWSDWY